MKDHYFIAAAIPTDTKQEIYEHSKVIHKYGDFKSFVHPQDYHVTLAFLGNIGFSQLQTIKKELAILASKHKEIPMQVKGIEVFGNVDSPRVIWADVMVYNRLLVLQKEITETCDRLQINYDKKEYRPHITIGRRWNEEYSFPIEDIKNDFVKNNHNSFSIQHIVLYKTHRDRLPKYQPIGIYSLHS